MKFYYIYIYIYIYLVYVYRPNKLRQSSTYQFQQLVRVWVQEHRKNLQNLNNVWQCSTLYELLTKQIILLLLHNPKFKKNYLSFVIYLPEHLEYLLVTENQNDLCNLSNVVKINYNML